MDTKRIPMVGLVLLLTACGGGSAGGAADLARDTVVAADVAMPDAGVRDVRADLGALDVRAPADLPPPSELGPDTGAGDAADGTGLAEVVDATAAGDAADVADALMAADVRDARDAADAPAASDAADVACWDAAAGPPSVTVTVDEIPAAMNGSIPYMGADHPETAFRLRVPLWRFTVDVSAQAAAGGAPVDWTTLAVQARLTAADGTVTSADLTPGFALAGGAAHWQVPEASPFAAGTLQLTATVADVAGQPGAPSELTVEVTPLPPELDPFVNPDTWLITFSRDIFELTARDNGDGTQSLDAVYRPEGNGVSDFDEAFRALGLFSDNAAATAFVRAQILGRLRAMVYTIFHLAADGGITADSVPLRLYFEGDEGAPDATAFAAGGFSMIAVGGDGVPDDITSGYVGMSLLDPNNQSEQDDTTYGLGVFTTQIARDMLRNRAAMLLLREITPLGGTPIGMDAGDAVFLVPGFDPSQTTNGHIRARYALYKLALDALGVGLASLLCHEMMHALGLVPPGPPPGGLFGGMAGLPFTESDSEGWHIDTPGLNVEQTGRQTNTLEALSADPHFNEMSLAYLRRRLVVDPAAGGGTTGKHAAVAERCP